MSKLLTTEMIRCSRSMQK